MPRGNSLALIGKGGFDRLLAPLHRWVWADGKRYTGGYLNGMQNGDGDFKFPNGDHYVGQMKDGLMDGKGKFTFASGDVYIGESSFDVIAYTISYVLVAPTPS